MKTISLKKAHKILGECSAVIINAEENIINDDAVGYPYTAELEGDEENEFLYLSWNEKNSDYAIKFMEGNNKKVAVNGSTMTLYDNEGDPIKLTILERKNLEG